MIKSWGPAIALAFLFSITALAFRAVIDNEQRLAARVSEIDRPAGDEALKAELSCLRRAMTAIEAASRDASEKLAEENRREIARVLAARPGGPDVIAMARAMLLPSVQIGGQGELGGGTIIHSEPDARGEYQTYAITAYHVVAKCVFRDDRGVERRLPVDVKVYRLDGEPGEPLQADIVLFDDPKDMALLKLRSTEAHPAATVMSREKLRTVSVFTPIYAVGCPLGHAPLPSAGEITTLRKEVNGERFWMMDAPTIFGNSGGGVFHRDSYEWIGVSTMVCTFDNPVAMPVPHLGILLSADAIADWLGENHYESILTSTADSLGAKSGRVRSSLPRGAPVPAERPEPSPAPRRDW